MNKKTLAIGGIILLIGAWVAVTFNSLVKKDEKVKLQWNEVQNAYQRRMSLIPNLVNTVKGEADFEQSTLEKIAEARAKVASVNVENISAENYNQQNAAQGELANAANRLVIAIEKYPSLKGTDAFRGLQVQLEGTERRIKVARKDFNAAIENYNSSVRGFPVKLVAGIFGFAPKEGFQSDAGAEKPAEIKFN